MFTITAPSNQDRYSRRAQLTRVEAPDFEDLNFFVTSYHLQLVEKLPLATHTAQTTVRLRSRLLIVGFVKSL